MLNITSPHIILILLSLLSFFCVTSKRVITSCWILISMFILSALLWFDWGAQFLSYSLILVYVGAIMTIFLFAVHLLQVKNNTINKYLLIFFSLILTAISYYNYFLVNEKTTFIKFDLNQIAKSLYVDYGLGLICIGLILLVSIVSAVTMLKNPKIKVKQQLKPGKIIWDDEL